MRTEQGQGKGTRHLGTAEIQQKKRIKVMWRYKKWTTDASKKTKSTEIVSQAEKKKYKNALNRYWLK